MSDYADLYMESFVTIIDAMAKENGFKKGEFAVSVWPGISPLVAARRWQYMRNGSHITGHPQGVLLSDALRMSEILEVDLPYVLLKARVMTDAKKADAAQESSKAKPSGKKQPEKKTGKPKTAHR